jgi:hypothetical protein
LNENNSWDNSPNSCKRKPSSIIFPPLKNGKVYQGGGARRRQRKERVERKEGDVGERGDIEPKR